MSNTIIHPLTQTYLKSIFDYNRDDGTLLGRERRPGARKSRIAGHADKSTGYLKVRVNRTLYVAHRLIWVMVYGAPPKGEVDHIDGFRANNEIENLRDVSRSGNQKNARLMSNSNTGIMGVNNEGGKYRVTISVNQKKTYIGFYEDFFHACCIRKSLELKHDYHPNHGRP